MSSEVDRSVWDSWAEIEEQGAENFTVELFELFLETSGPLLKQLEQAFKDQDLKKISHFAHSLKSSSGQMGAMALHQELETVEIRSRTSADPIPDEVFQQIARRLERVREEILAECRLRRAKT